MDEIALQTNKLLLKFIKTLSEAQIQSSFEGLNTVEIQFKKIAKESEDLLKKIDNLENDNE